MTDSLKADREKSKADLQARHKAEARFAESASGMQALATRLRRDADAMADTNDRDAMLRLAAGFEQRAAARVSGSG